ncbi:hypothetical protein G6L37_01360 [Agrobacterium rubi]|nr:hypothetical protein [Agrobacterium rubi]NTF24040.1 hypothetical protein [Agrobacterium rubi]
MSTVFGSLNYFGTAALCLMVLDAAIPRWLMWLDAWQHVDEPVFVSVAFFWCCRQASRLDSIQMT